MFTFRFLGFPDGLNVLFPHAMIGGSTVVNPVLANDIDVIVHEFEHDMDALLNRDYRRLCDGDEKYDEIDGRRLVAVYEKLPIDGTGKKINVIVVGAEFWPAYIGAIREMQVHPFLYNDREKRVHLHKSKCQAVAGIAGVNFEG